MTVYWSFCIVQESYIGVERDAKDSTYITDRFNQNKVLTPNQLQPACTPDVQARGTQQYLLLEVDFLVQAGGFRCG